MSEERHPARRVADWFDVLLSEGEDPTHHHFALARYALKEEGIEKPPEASVYALVQALHEVLPLAHKLFGLDNEDTKENSAPHDQDEMLWLDARAASFLDAIGLAETAQELRTRSKERWQTYQAQPQPGDVSNPVWRLWYETDSPEPHLPKVRFLRLLPRFLWQYRVSQRLEREGRYKAPALPKELVDLATEAFHLAQKTIIEEEFKWIVTSQKTGKMVAHIEKEDLAALARRPFAPMVDREVATNLSASRSLSGQRLLRFLVGRGFHQKLIEPQYDYRAVRVKGGLTGLAMRLGMEKGKASEKLGLALDALQTTKIALPHGGHESVLMWSLYPEAPGRGAELKIILGDVILPGYVFAMPDRTDSERQARRLIPFPELMPLMVGSPNLHAAQAVLQMMILEELSDRAEEFLERGSIEINDANWKELCDRAELPSRIVPELKEAWVKGDGDKTPAFLEEPENNRYGLSEAYGKERKVIEETAELTKKSRARGKASVRARRGAHKKK